MIGTARRLLICLVLQLPIIAIAQPCGDWSQIPPADLNWFITVDRLVDWNDVLVTADHQIRTWDVTEPEDPVLLDALPLPGAAETRNLRRHGDRIYAACGEAGLFWIDLTDPTDLTLTGNWTPGSAVNDAVGFGDLVVVVTAAGNVDVVDASTSELIGRLEYASDQEPVSVVVTGDYALASFPRALVTVDLFDPAAPTVASTVTGHAPPVTACDGLLPPLLFDDLLVDGETVYATGEQLLQCDGSAPPTPVMRRMLMSLDISTLPYVEYSAVRQFDGAASVAVHSGHVFGAGNGVMVVDRDPGLPPVTWFGLGAHLDDVCIVGGTVFGTTGSQLFSVSLDAVDAVGPLNIIDGIGDMESKGRFRLFRQRHEDVDSAWIEYALYDLGRLDTTEPIFTDAFYYDDDAYPDASVVILGIGETRCAIARMTGFAVTSVQVIDNETGEVGAVTGYAPRVGAVFQGDLLWGMQEWYADLALWDTSDLANITQLGSWPLDGSRVFELRGSHLIQDNGNSLRAIDISDSQSPTVHDGTSVTNHGKASLAYIGDLVVRFTGYVLETVDLSDPANPVTRGSLNLNLGDDPHATAVDHIAVVSGASSYFQVVSVADPDNPVLLGQPVGPQILDVVFDGRLLYAASTFGVRAYDLAAPSVPREIGAVGGPSSQYGLVRHDQMLICGRAAYPLHCYGVTMSPVPANETLLLRTAPNPFNPMTTVHFVLPTSTRATVAVHDLRGRLVRTLVDRTLPIGPNTVTWNGRDDAGRELASGLYLVRLVTPDAVETTKAVLVR